MKKYYLRVISNHAHGSPVYLEDNDPRILQERLLELTNYDQYDKETMYIKGIVVTSGTVAYVYAAREQRTIIEILDLPYKDDFLAWYTNYNAPTIYEKFKSEEYSNGTLVKTSFYSTKNLDDTYSDLAREVSYTYTGRALKQVDDKRFNSLGTLTFWQTIKFYTDTATGKVVTEKTINEV